MIKSLQEKNGWVCIQLEGDIYVQDASLMREELLSYTESGKANFDFDFSKVTFIDSAGLGVLVAIYKRAAQHNGQVKISHATGSVKELFELTRLNLIFQIEG
ncbi:STAS domain-containing protein [Salipaludibacillus sp. HK11]|uniref:STAS domain-containing protein n=1 Tax=Salipaludibacillus sp. HK11 TaxID=3394320 RepID=UPI0039FBCB9F